jgi:hypothetical protein
LALEEQPRENLLRDATAYGERILLWDLQNQTEIFFGLRSDGSWSIYVGEDPVLQFNAHGQLRRAYFAGKKYAAVDGNLWVVQRDTRGGRVQLKQAYDPDAEQAIKQACLDLRRKLVEGFQQHHLAIRGCYPPNQASLTTTLLDKLEGLGAELRIATVANAAG